MEPDGTSHLWDAMGKRFTNLTYREADRLSHENKDFIRDLFPSQSVYSCLLSDEAQRVIGEVGTQTKGVQKMLTRIGFAYNDRVDPFDGGPHFTATTDQVAPIRAYRMLPAVVDSPSDLTLVLLARFWAHPPYALAVTAYVGLAPDHVAVTESVLEALQSQEGDPLHITLLR